MRGNEVDQPMPMSPDDVEPGRLRVFGVCHIVFGGLGLMNAAGGIAMHFLREPLSAITQPDVPHQIQEIQSSLYRDLAIYTWINAGMSVILGVLILRAGIALTKRRQSSVRLSNIYAVSSLIAKGAGILIFLVVAMPVIGDAISAMLADGSAVLPAWMGALRVLIVVIALGSFLLSTIYPLCSLIMLNKTPVKQYLAKHGG